MKQIAATAVIITKNEERNLSDCLTSLHEFDEVVLVDNGSTDSTLSIASAFSNVRVIESNWLGYGATRQVGVEQARNEWIFWIDADERIPPQLSSEIRTLLATATQNNVVALRRNNFFLGRQIHGCGWSPDWVVRLFHRKHASFNQKTVHEGLTGFQQSDVIQARAPLTHHSYRSARQFFEKNLKYATLAADERKRTQRKVSFWQIPLRTGWEFFRNYILRRGIFDGIPGFLICGGSAIYVFTRDAICYLESRTVSTTATPSNKQNEN